MQYAEGNKAKRGNDRLAPFLSANSSQGVLAVRATPCRRVQEARVAHTYSRPGSASRVWWSARISVGCRPQTRRDGADISAACRSSGSFGITSLVPGCRCKKQGYEPELAKRMHKRNYAATKAKWVKDGLVALFKPKSLRHSSTQSASGVSATRDFPHHLPDICGLSPDRKHVLGNGSLTKLGQSMQSPQVPAPSPSTVAAMRQSLAHPCRYGA
jgi:hypothetical protein